MRRRKNFSIVVLISQLLLIALAVSWLIHMTIIQIYGSVNFVEKNPVILWMEIVVTVIIIIFGGSVFILQIKRLGEKRLVDKRTELTDKRRLEKYPR